ncbi:MAG: DEAD/DEAH box helicase, partial [Nitrososphaerota archaeon]|nr:DEAD/DEAH box helicase [Nitrososphaerota archaeon]
MGSYDLLSPYIKDLIIEKGFKEETEVQEDAIAKILSGENALIVSPTGSGKTEAAILPILDMIVKGTRRGGVSLLYISPLRALNRDLLERLEWWTKRLDIRMAVRHGDTPVEERRAQSLAPPEILITTPETLQVLLVSRNLAESLKSVKYLIIDEIHELAGDKRGSQLSMSVIRLEALTGYSIQKIGLSATIGNPEELAKFLSPNEKCAVIQVFSPKSFEYEVVYQKADDSDTGGPLFPDVVHRLKFILNHIRGKKALIFTNTRSEAESLASKVRMLEPRYPIGIHHGSLSAERRGGAEMSLKGGSIKGVICTSSLELGIDIG